MSDNGPDEAYLQAYGCGSSTCSQVSPSHNLNIVRAEDADFSFHAVDSNVQFSSLNTEYDSIIWEMDNLGFVKEPHPFYVFSSEGDYTVLYHKYFKGCVSSAEKMWP
ncbi:MAG: hypothetical protein HC896_03400 [Bacteroidales bacterium]|nr:hypothetical protein [Bacteroidales bacterium]